MNLKLVGAVLIFVTCGSVGFRMAATHRLEVRTLQQLVAALEHMECQLLYRMSPLPQLCRSTAEATDGLVRKFFLALAAELESQVAPEVFHCVQAALCQVKGFPGQSAAVVEHFGASLGAYDLDGQLKAIAGTKQACSQTLQQLVLDQDSLLRSYQTLGLCAGAAVVILFV